VPPEFLRGPAATMVAAILTEENTKVRTGGSESYNVSQGRLIVAAEIPGVRFSRAACTRVGPATFRWMMGRTIRSPSDCLIAACVLGQSASLLENDADFHSIAEAFPLRLVSGG